MTIFAMMDSLMANSARALLFLVIGGALASCGMSDDTISSIVVAPPPAEYRNCAQLIEGIKGSIAAQENLQALERRAAEDGGAGTVIAETTYRPQYLTQRGSEINMRRSAREKGCKLPADLPPVDRR